MPRRAGRLAAIAAWLVGAIAAEAAPGPAAQLTVLPRAVRAGDTVVVTAEIRGERLDAPADVYVGVNDSHDRPLVLQPNREVLGRELLPVLRVAPGQRLVHRFRVRVPGDTVPSWYKWGLLLVRSGTDPMRQANQLGGVVAYGRVDEPSSGAPPRALAWTLALAAGLAALLVAAWRRRREHPSALLGYGVLAVLLTYPLAGHLTRAVPGMFGSDAYQFLWSLWWVRRALGEEWASPFFTRAIFAPEGLGLAFHALTPLNGLAALPLQLVGGLPLASNLIQLGAFVLSGWGTFLLLRTLGSSRPAAFVAGFIFAFSPLRFIQLAEGHYNLTSAYWLPLTLAFEVRALRGSAAWRREAIVAGACLAGAAWTDHQVLIFALLLATVIAALSRTDPAGGAPARPAAIPVMAGTFVLGAAPLLGPAVRDVLAGYAAVPGILESGATLFKKDLLGFLVPSVFHPVLGGWALRLAERFGWTLEHTAYLGLVPLLLAATALGRLRRDHTVRCWAGIALGSLVLSLGPFPSIAGAAYPAIPLPYRLLAAVPVLNNLRGPNRFAVCLVLALAVLAGLALTRWAERWAGPAWVRRTALGAVAGAIVFEFVAIPIPLASAAVPEVYMRIGEAREDGLVLEVPLGRAAAFASAGSFFPAQMYWQSAHGKRLIGGYVSRASVDRTLALKAEPIFASLLELQAGADLPAARLLRDREGAPELVARLNLRWVLVHPPFYHGKVERYLREVLPLEPLADRDGIAAYRVVRGAGGREASAGAGRIAPIR